MEVDPVTVNIDQTSYSHRVGVRLREVRVARGLSLFDVECVSGRKIKASILGSYERCERVINVDRLAALAEFYEVEVSDLLPLLNEN